MSQEVSPQPVTTETEFQLQAKPCDILVGKVTLGQVFHRVIRFSLPLSLHHCSIIIFVHALPLIEGKQTKPGDIPISNVLSESGKHW